MRAFERWGILTMVVAGALLAIWPAAGGGPGIAGDREDPPVAGEVPTLTAKKAPPGPGERLRVMNQVGEIRVETIPAMTALVLPMTGSYEQHGEAILQVVTRAASTGIIRGAPFGVYHSSPEETPEDSLRWDICVPVAADAEAKPPFEVRQLPAMEAAVVTCTGPYEGTSPCYGALSAWLVPSGYQLGGSPQEHWISDTRTTPPEMCVARILFPIVKRER